MLCPAAAAISWRACSAVMTTFQIEGARTIPDGGPHVQHGFCCHPLTGGLVTCTGAFQFDTVIWMELPAL